jgi:hypothetical protein
MTSSAWIMLAVTWSVIVFFTAKFFLKILRSPSIARDEEGPPRVMGKDA